MKKLFIALSLCACLTACDHQYKYDEFNKPETYFIEPNEKIIGYTSVKSFITPESSTYMTVPMMEDDIAECYKIRRLSDRRQVILCERKEDK